MAQNTAVKHNEVIQPNLFQDEIRNSKLLSDNLEIVTADMKALLKVSKEVANASKGNNKEDISAVNQAYKQGTEAIKTHAKATEQLIRLKRDEERTLNTRIKLEAQKLRATEKATAQARKEEREAKKLESSYSRLSKRLNDLRKRYKDVAASEGVMSKNARKLRAELVPLDAKLKSVDASAGQFQRNVGNYPKIFSSATAALGSLGLVGGLTGLVEVLRGSINIFADFEKANSDLQAVLNVSKSDMKGLRDLQIELGSSTSFTASEVANLQTEFAKLGFPTSDILKLTESTLFASAAMGSGLAETAALTGSILKTYGLNSSEAARINDVLSRSTSASALDFEKLSGSLSTILPVANKFGFSVESSIALLGKLSDAGFDASSGATATRNILLNLADVNGKLSKSLKEPVKDLPSLVRGLKQLKEEGTDLATAFELTDKRSVAAFTTFINGTDDILKLNDALETATGTAEKMSKIKLDNLTGDIKLLTSAWEGFVLSLTEGDSAFSKVVRGTVQLLTDEVNGLIFFAQNREILQKGISKTSEETLKNLLKFGEIAKETLKITGSGNLKKQLDGLFKSYDLADIIKSSEIAGSKIGTAQRSFNEFFLEQGIGITETSALWKVYLKGVKEAREEEIKAAKELEKQNSKTKETTSKDLKKDKKERDDALRRYAADERRRIELLDNRIFKQLAKEELRYKLELAAAKDHKENLELVEKVHAKRLDKIRRDAFKSDFEVTSLNFDKEKEEEIKADDERIKNQGEKRKAEKEKRERDSELERKQKLAENEARLELATAVIGKLSELEDSVNKKRLDSINNEISKFAEQRTLLQQQAAEGNQDALNSLQDLDKRQAELEAQREREIAKKKRSELLLIALKLLSANLQGASSGSEAITQTASQIGQTTALVNSLPSFESGIDDTSPYSKGQGVDGKGGFNAVLHGGEKVMNATDTAKTGGLSNYAIGEVVQKYNSGQLTDINKSFESVNVSDNSNIEAAINENTKAVTKAIANQKTFYDANSKAIVETTRYSNNFINTHHKVRTL